MFDNETSIFDSSDGGEEEGLRQVIVALVIMIMFIISLNACYRTKCWTTVTRLNIGLCTCS
jgi:hypothetical protein